VSESKSPETSPPETAGGEQSEAAKHPLLAKLAARFPGDILSSHCFRGDATAILKRDSLKEICGFLRDDPELAFDMLLDVTAADYLGRTPRFEVVYHLYSVSKNHRLRLKVALEEQDLRVPSLTSLWVGANWLERETYDMYGIQFEGHPDLRRIYLYEEFQGHPLRKDYPKEKRQPLIGPGSPHPAATRRQPATSTEE
jgi:NADH-quinone oxidoreductase subunit C